MKVSIINFCTNRLSTSAKKREKILTLLEYLFVSPANVKACFLPFKQYSVKLNLLRYHKQYFPNTLFTFDRLRSASLYIYVIITIYSIIFMTFPRSEFNTDFH